MKFGLSQVEYDFVTQTVVRPFKGIGLEVFCYGSRARGDFHKFSDLDLMIEGPSTQQAKILRSQIEENLSKSNFPYKVDLVFLDEFATSYKKNYFADKKTWNLDTPTVD